ncbi:MAG: hypothetical protein QOE01_1901, partial [Actinomycetota bacterium]|nr:hypothetical protein [Actinomycetota bacterium]
MSNTDKAKNRAQELKGQVKEQAGTVSGDQSKRRSGQRDAKRANLK